MATNYYLFIDKFIVPCDIEAAYHYIRQIEEYPRWWGKVYKKIVKLKDAPPDTPGAKYKITVGGFLPYTLTIENEVRHIDKPKLIRFFSFLLKPLFRANHHYCVVKAKEGIEKDLAIKSRLSASL